MPWGLVVKKGSKSRRPTSSAMPPPVSATETSTVSPRQRLAMVISPPLDSTSMPFLTRLKTAWRRSPRSISSSGHTAIGLHPHRQALARGHGAHELGQLGHQVIDGLLLEVRLGKARELQILLGERVEGAHLVEDGLDEMRGLLALGARPAASRCPASISAFSSMALMGLRTSCATLRDSRPTVAMRSATSSSPWVVSSRVSVPFSSSFRRSTSPRARRSRSATRPRVTAGRPASTDTMMTASPAHPGRDERRRRRVETARGQGRAQSHQRAEVVGVDGDQREEEQVEDALGTAGQAEQREDQTEVDGQRAEEDQRAWPADSR